MEQVRYRPDIDGLRALAVVPVVLFHADLPGFAGGFVGVDVFYVISGYLITSLISHELAAGRFSVAAFYERRIRRIFPALFAVIAFSAIAGLFVLFPTTYDAFAQSMVATSLFSSNILFWLQSGYFDASATTKPLLHTWSLAVEEQFYVLFPLFLLAVYRWLNARWVTWIAIACALSFGVSLWATANHHFAAFYLAPMRAWELLTGALLAVGALPYLRHRAVREVSMLLGLGLIGWSVVAFSGLTPFPGTAALFPCVGAALVIHSGASGVSIARRVLSWAPFVFVGLISYSLYLWHWPILVLAENASATVLPVGLKIGLVAISVLAAAASWRFVERPLRGAEPWLQRRGVFVGAASLSLAAVAFGMWGHVSDGWPGRLDARAEALAAYRDEVDPRRAECGNRAIVDPCSYGANVAPTFAVWGDSHAGAFIAAIGELAERHGRAVKFIGSAGCPPIVGIHRIDDPADDCWQRNNQVMDYLVQLRDIETVIMIGRYAASLYGSTYDFGPAERDGERTPRLSNGGDALDVGRAEDVFARQMEETVDRLTAAGKRVVLVYPVPETGYDIPETLARVVLTGQDPARFARPRDYYASRQRFILGVLDSLAGDIVRVYPDRLLCDESRCIVYADGQPLYRDDDHVSMAGARYLMPLFEPAFR